MKLKHFTKFVVALALLLLAWQGQVFAQTYTGVGGGPIPPTGTGSTACGDGPTLSVATVPITGTVGLDLDITAVDIDITHTFDGDLEITLLSPMGSSLVLASGIGGADDDFTGTTFTDGFPNITSGTAPYSFTYEPQAGTLLGAFGGESITGTWILAVCDNTGGDVGTLNSFSITFGDVVEPPPGPEPCSSVASYDGDNEGAGISDFVTTTSEIEVPAGLGVLGVDCSIESVELDLTHTFDGDLDITLITPSGASILLSDQNGGSGDDFIGTVFMDGAVSLGTGTPPYTGTFSPDVPFSALNGEDTEGTWKLEIFDNFGGDIGAFGSVTLNICEDDPPPPPSCDLITPYDGDGGGSDASDLAVSEIEVTGSGTIGVDATIESVELDITHTFDGDLEITLVSPLGTPISLSSANGGAGDDFDGTIIMDGAPPLSSGAPPYAGTFAPDGGSMNATFAGQSITGTWTLLVDDIFPLADGGTFNGVTLNICTEENCDADGFVQTDIGCASGGGEYCYDAPADTWTLTSEACFNPAFYRPTDSENMVSTEICGDVEIIAEVTGVTGSGFAGIALREDLSDDSKMLQLMVDGSFLTRRELRQSSPGIAYAHLFPTAGRNWLRLTRTGNIFGAYHSVDGVNWAPVLITNIAMATCIEVGLVTQNSLAMGEVEATFENVSILSGPTLQAPDVEVETDVVVREGFFAYPNPANNVAHVDLNNYLGQAINMEVYNSIGQMVYTQKIDEVNHNIETIDVSNYESGFYLIRIKTENTEYTNKLVVKR